MLNSAMQIKEALFSSPTPFCSSKIKGGETLTIHATVLPFGSRAAAAALAQHYCCFRTKPAGLLSFVRVPFLKDVLRFVSATRWAPLTRHTSVGPSKPCLEKNTRFRDTSSSTHYFVGADAQAFPEDVQMIYRHSETICKESPLAPGANRVTEPELAGGSLTKTSHSQLRRRRDSTDKNNKNITVKIYVRDAGEKKYVKATGQRRGSVTL
ncbi:hypothetical protein EVAR_69498_1 [Eumeta japonica]|uniref:Uncharacterized protein n=1 Tax=Eumeta variegata TaxID=151549 RepID=A0A4C2AGS9_EUMVA|nr:hypothetical protein EVAR_69498_1 [Eumeta japonica]